jgi:hypothetical protein
MRVAMEFLRLLDATMCTSVVDVAAARMRKSAVKVVI